MKKIRGLVLIVVVLLAANVFAIDTRGANCVATYMSELERCTHMTSGGGVCWSDATLEYVGCIRSTLLFYRNEFARVDPGAGSWFLRPWSTLH